VTSTALSGVVVITRWHSGREVRASLVHVPAMPLFYGVIPTVGKLFTHIAFTVLSETGVQKGVFGLDRFNLTAYLISLSALEAKWLTALECTIK